MRGIGKDWAGFRLAQFATPKLSPISTTPKIGDSPKLPLNVTEKRWQREHHFELIGAVKEVIIVANTSKYSVDSH